jgi:glycosyltransferase involved in cell wall biosynthesis
VPVTLIPNGLDPTTTPARTSVRDIDRPVFACIANYFSPRKNTGAAVEAIVELRRTIPGARLLALGHGHEPGGPAQQWAQARKVDEGVDWLGPVEHDEVLRLLRAEVDAVVHPSLNESCSIAIMEAQSIGVPVIGGRDSGGVSMFGGRRRSPRRC